jgi:hypothetical protein
LSRLLVLLVVASQGIALRSQLSRFNAIAARWHPRSRAGHTSDRRRTSWFDTNPAAYRRPP